MMETSESARLEEATTQVELVRSEAGYGGNGKGERIPEGANTGDKGRNDIRHQAQTQKTKISRRVRRR